MKVSDIRQGGIYHDNKLGVREVVSMEGSPLRITYRILAAKVEQHYSYCEEKMVSLVGTTVDCDLASFAKWAKVAVSSDEVQRLLSKLSARRLRLAPGEIAFMRSVCKCFVGAEAATPTTTISFDFNETRTVRGLAKKGVLSVASEKKGVGGEFVLTNLGVAWIDLAVESSVAQ